MAYVQVDFDAIANAVRVAPLCGLSHFQITGGLVNLWQWCWTEKHEVVSEVQLSAFFPGAQNLASALEAFGFLAVSDGGWRVRGADRYLRIDEAKVRAGKARAATSTKRKGGKFVQQTTSRQPARAGAVLVDPPAGDQQGNQQPPALTQNTEHRTQNTEKEEAKDLSPAQPATVIKLPPVSLEPAAPKPAEVVYRVWARTLGKPDLPMGREDWSILGARLKDGCTVEQLCQAAVGAKLDAERWPERKAQNEIKFVYGSMGQVRKFVDLVETGNPRTLPKDGYHRAEDYKNNRGPAGDRTAEL